MYTLMIGIEYISIALLIFEIIYVMKQKGSYMQNLIDRKSTRLNSSPRT